MPNPVYTYISNIFFVNTFCRKYFKMSLNCFLHTVKWFQVLLYNKASTQSSVMSRDSSAGSFILCGSKIFSGEIIFLYAHTMLVVTLPSGLPLLQFIWHFHHVLFTLRNRWPSCFATHITFTACQRHLSVSIQHLQIGKWLQVLLFNSNYSIIHYSFICRLSNGSKYCYVIWIIQFRYIVNMVLMIPL